MKQDKNFQLITHLTDQDGEIRIHLNDLQVPPPEMWINSIIVTEK